MPGPTLTPSDLDQISTAVTSALVPLVDRLAAALVPPNSASSPGPARVAMSRTPPPEPISTPAPTPTPAKTVEESDDFTIKNIRQKLAQTREAVGFYESLEQHLLTDAASNR